MEHHVAFVLVPEGFNERELATERLQQLHLPELGGWQEYDACRWDDVFLDGASSVSMRVEDVIRLDASFAPSFVVAPDMYYDYRLHRPWKRTVQSVLSTHPGHYVVLYLVVTSSENQTLAS